MTGRVWLVRHGRTAWNGGRFLGRADVPLADAGRDRPSRPAGCWRPSAGPDLDQPAAAGPRHRRRDRRRTVCAATGTDGDARPDGAGLRNLGGPVKGTMKISKHDPDDTHPRR